MDTLGGGVGALVELAGEEFEGEGGFVGGEGEFGRGGFDLWLGEDELGGFLEFFGAEAIEVVSLDDTGRLDGVDGEIGAEISNEVRGF